MAVTVSERLLMVDRGRDREGLMPAIAGRDRDRQGSNPVSRPSGVQAHAVSDGEIPFATTCIKLNQRSYIELKR